MKGSPVESTARVRSCPRKCGGVGIATLHGAQQTAEEPECSTFPVPHVHRTCASCGHEWAEEPESP